MSLGGTTNGEAEVIQDFFYKKGGRRNFGVSLHPENPFFEPHRRCRLLGLFRKTNFGLRRRGGNSHSPPKKALKIALHPPPPFPSARFVRKLSIVVAETKKRLAGKRENPLFCLAESPALKKLSFTPRPGDKTQLISPVQLDLA